MGEEVRVTSDTGGQKGRKPEQFYTMPPEAIFELARVYRFGAGKYADYNFRLGYDWSLSFDALMRHAFEFWSGKDLDEESGLNHMAHVAWHALNLVLFSQYHRAKDDRPTGPAAEYERETEEKLVVGFTDSEDTFTEDEGEHYYCSCGVGLQPSHCGCDGLEEYGHDLDDEVSVEWKDWDEGDFYYDVRHEEDVYGPRIAPPSPQDYYDVPVVADDDDWMEPYLGENPPIGGTD